MAVFVNSAVWIALKLPWNCRGAAMRHCYGHAVDCHESDIECYDDAMKSHGVLRRDMRVRKVQRNTMTWCFTGYHKRPTRFNEV